MTMLWKTYCGQHFHENLFYDRQEGMYPNFYRYLSVLFQGQPTSPLTVFLLALKSIRV